MLDKGIRRGFSEDIIKQAWKRSGGQCECLRSTHGHQNRCQNLLKYENRGFEGKGSWDSHRRIPAGGESFYNCEILCGPCYKKIQFFNR